MFDWIISALLFVVALGLLICLHELGHFSMAKLFNVYCHEFSIGFGPALLHKRKEGKETYFSIRAIPVGGYVAMYGDEEQELEPGLKLPPERSIEGIKKWKKAIIVSAGVVVNALLAVVIFAVSNLCFPNIDIKNEIRVSENTVLTDVQSGDAIANISYTYPGKPEATSSSDLFAKGKLYVIDDNVTLENNENHYVLCFNVYSEKEDNKLSNCLHLYVGKKNTELEGYEEWKKVGEETSEEPFYLPDTSSIYEGDATFSANIRFVRGDSIVNNAVTLHTNNKVIDDLGVSFILFKQFAPFEVRFKQIWVDYANSATGVVRGLISLITRPVETMSQASGIVGIFVASETIFSTYSFASYLYLWGFLSVNLAIFNLLPFPGLDGWQLLVTIIEGVSKKKLPKKFKTIMSVIGFVLLALLMVVILVFDIIKIASGGII